MRFQRTSPAEPSLGANVECCALGLGGIRAWWLSYGIVCLFTLVVFVPSLFYLITEYLGHSATDMNIAYRHYLTFGVRWLRKGILPQWNPHIFCGTQFLPSTCATLHQPLNALLLTTLPLPLAANIIIIIHLMLLGWGVTFWSKILRLSPMPGALAGILAVSSSAAVGRVFAGHFTIVSTLPWAIWFLASAHNLIRQNGKGWVVTGIFGALMFLGGHLQTSYYALLLGWVVVAAALAESGTISCFASWKRAIGAFTGSCALSVGLAAIELVPVADALRYSARVVSADTSWIRRFSLPPENLFLLLFPYGLGSPLDYMGRWFWWEASPATSVAGIIVALAVLLGGRERRESLRVPLAVVITATFLSMTPDLPVANEVVRLIPGWGALRGHAKIFAYALCLLPILTATGIEAWYAGDQRVRKAVLHASVVTAGLALFLVAGAGDSAILAYAKSESVLKDRLFGPSPTNASGARLLISSLHRAAWHTLVVCALLGGLTLSTRFWVRRYACPLLALLFASESFFIAAGTANHRFAPEENSALRDFAAEMNAKNDFNRLEVIPDGLVNAAMTYNVSTPGGNDVNISRFFDSFLAAAEGAPSTEPHLHFRASFPSPLWDYAALRYLFIPKDQQVRTDLGVRRFAEIGNYTVWERENAFPYAHVPTRFTWITNKEDEIFRLLSDPAIMPKRDGTFLVGQQRSIPADARATTETVISVSRPDPMTIVLDVPCSGVVVVAEGYAPHWRAYDSLGNELPVYRANGAFLGAVVPKPMQLTLKYQNPFYMIGRLITLITIGVLTAAFGFFCARRLWPEFPKSAL